MALNSFYADIQIASDLFIGASSGNEL